MNNKLSVATLVIIAIVAATTIVLAACGIGYYIYERNRQMASLRHELSVNANQLAKSIAPPVWNYDDAQINRIIESAFMNNNIHAVILRAAEKSHVRIRNEKHSIVEEKEDFPKKDLLAEERDITYHGKPIGSLKLFVNLLLIKDKLRNTLVLIISSILIVNIILILSLFLIIRHIVLKPLHIIEQYAVSISDGAAAALNAGPDKFHGELATLRSSLEKMIQLLDERYNEIQTAAQELQNSQDFLNNIVENIPAMIFVKEAASLRFVKFNRAGEEMLGYSRAEMLGKNDYDFFPAEEAGSFAAKDREALHSGRLVKIPEEAIHTRHHGEIILRTKKIPIFDKTGNPQYLLGISEDITKEKRAELAMKESEDKYRATFLTSPDSININRIDGLYVDINEGFTALTGYTREDVIGKLSSAIDIWSIPEDRVKLIEGLKKNGIVENLESVFRCKDGSLKAGLMSARIINIKNEPHILSITRDITERKKTAAERRAMEVKLAQSQKMEAIGTLAGGVAHDFNNILAAIIGYTEMNIYETRKDILDRNLRAVLKAADRARNLVRQILTFSRQEKQEKILLDIKVLLKEAMKFLRASIPATIDIQQSVTADSCNIIADPTQMHQIIMNLCTNATHAMKQGGILKVDLATLELKSGELPQHPDLSPGHYIKLTVSDTGHGIEPANLPRIFDPFFTTKSAGEGTGLGLSVVYGIVQSHFGAINVYSEPGKGSVFTIYLPRIIHEEINNNDSPEEIIGGTERILFVDDESVLVELGKHLLSSLGYEVTGIASSLEALNVFSREPGQFDILITDMTMPKMTGITLARKILKIRPDIPVIVCSGIHETDTEEQIKGLGISYYCMKPLTIKQLSRMVRDALDGKTKTTK